VDGHHADDDHFEDKFLLHVKQPLIVRMDSLPTSVRVVSGRVKHAQVEVL